MLDPRLEQERDLRRQRAEFDAQRPPADGIEVTGDNTSGEAEFIIARIDGENWVGIGSDHTDRELEKQGITIAKQICDKPMGGDFWRYSEVADWGTLRRASTERAQELRHSDGARCSGEQVYGQRRIARRCDRWQTSRMCLFRP